MSVVLPIEDDPRFRIYVATTGQTTFAIPFPFQDAVDIGVYLDVEDTWTPVDINEYTITGAGEAMGGTVIFDAGRMQDETVLVLGQAALERLTSIVRNGRFDSRATDNELDRNRIIQQEIRRDVDRTLRVKIGGSPLELVDDFEEGDSLAYTGGRIGKGPNVLEIIEAAGDTEENAAAAAASAAAALTDRVLAQAAQVSASASQAQAQNLVDAAQAGYVGFQPGSFFDLGRVTDNLELFPGDLGRVTDL
ncbi:MAG: hypothetical protein ACK4M8_05400 [Allorhizobium sp.]